MHEMPYRYDACSNVILRAMRYETCSNATLHAVIVAIVVEKQGSDLKKYCRQNAYTSLSSVFRRRSLPSARRKWHQRFFGDALEIFTKNLCFCLLSASPKAGVRSKKEVVPAKAGDLAPLHAVAKRRMLQGY